MATILVGPSIQSGGDIFAHSSALRALRTRASGAFGSCHPTMANSSADFTSIPVLEYSLIAADRASFLKQLRHALINVGFLYLHGAPVDTRGVIAEIPRFFSLPQASKDALSKQNTPHFLGYTKPGSEYTKGAQDMREFIDLATPYTNQWKAGDPDYLRHWGPSQVARQRHQFYPCTDLSQPVAIRERIAGI